MAQRHTLRHSPAAWVALAVCISGCSTSHYRKSADSEAYGIIQQAEQRVLGHTNGFTIDTRYSGRDARTILPSEIIEDRMATNRRVLRLEEALRLAVENSREYQSQKELLYQRALNLTGARYDFAPHASAVSAGQLKGGGEEGTMLAPGQTNVFVGSGEYNNRLKTGSVSSRIGVSQLLKTGGSLTVSLANDLFHWYTGSSSYRTRNTAINTLSVDFIQPLLRGFGRNDPQVESLTQSEREVIYATRTYSQYQNQFAVDVVNDFFSLLGQKATIRNNYTNYLRRVETTKYLEARKDRVRQSDVDDARTAELDARIRYVNSVAGYQNQLDSFKLTLGLPMAEAVYLDDRDLADLEAAGLIAVDVDRTAAFRIAVEKHMDILNAIDKFEDSQRKIRVQADQLKTELNLVANARLASDGPHDYTRFDPAKLEYSVGLNLDLPIDRLRERNAYRATLISFESQLRSLASTLDTFRQRIERGLRTLEQQRLNHENGKAQLEVARRRADMNQTLLAAGRVQIRDVREAQDSLVAAQNQLTLTTVSYLQARLQVLLDIGVTDIAPDRFWLQDPLANTLPAESRSRMPGRQQDELIPPDQFLEPAS